MEGELTPQGRYRGSLLGLAAGDALGTTLEFQPPGSFTPIDDIVGGGPFHLEPGQWTDDTSMALCLAESLVEVGGHDPADQMQRYLRWYREGYLSSTGVCFDIGTTVGTAVRRFERTRDPLSGSTDPMAAGNGSLMRMAPVPLAFAGDGAEAVWLAGESSRTTHGAREAVDACRYMAALIVGALHGEQKERLLASMYAPVDGLWEAQPLAPTVAAIAAGSFRAKRPPQIRGTGYVVDALEAALWALDGASSFREACLRAVNLGNDADTTGAIVGQLAGALWGVGGVAGVPTEWVERLARRGEIEHLADRLFAMATQPGMRVGGGVPRMAQGPPQSAASEASRFVRDSTSPPPLLPVALAARAYWVAPPRFLAGAYPGDTDASRHDAKVEALLSLGITAVVTLMEETEANHGGSPFVDYASALEAQGVVVERHGIRDLTAPTVEVAVETLDSIDRVLLAGGRVYVHCWGGRGRTGTIVGCWLVRHGWVEPSEAVRELGRLRSGCADAATPVPDTQAQVRLIESWRLGM